LIVALTNFFPVPEASTCAVTWRDPSVPLTTPRSRRSPKKEKQRLKARTHGLKSWTVTGNVPSPDASTGVALSMFCATFTVPHGALAEGRWTSLRASWPFTPRAGEIPACAWTWVDSAARATRADARTVLTCQTAHDNHHNSHRTTPHPIHTTPQS
jgi:hypothetical protein